MAHRLLDAGHAVTVWNRDPARAEALVAAGARQARTPREAATGAAVVLSMVRDDAASRTVWFGHDAAAADGAMPASTVHRDGALAGLGADAIALESSTVTPAWIAMLGAAVTARGATLLDAPVVGSRPQAEAGQLVHLVGGDATAFARAHPLLAVLGGAAHHVGALGAGATTKLVVNALFAVQVAAVAELLRLGATHGLDRARTVEVLGALAVTSPAAKGAMALMQAGADAPQFPIELVVKDLAYAVALGEGVPVQPAMTAAAHAVFAAAAAQGLGDRNITAVRLLSSSA
jgi:3-hydroxyisobutyrate dehydrogenase-like beta-hydroxyacid dehydrogenase